MGLRPMKSTLMFSLLTAALFATGGAQAGGGNLLGGDGESSMTEGVFYGGGSYGKTDAICDKSDDGCEGNGWKIFGGYKLTDNIAVEGGYYNLGESEQKGVAFTDAATSISGTTDMSVKASGIGLTGVYSVPVMDNFEVFGKAGVMIWDAEAELTNTVATGGSALPSITDSVDGTDAMFGVGANYNFTENWGVRGEYEKVGGDLDAGIYSVGATFSSL